LHFKLDTAHRLHHLLVFIAFCGFAYGAMALFALGTGWSSKLERRERGEQQAEGIPNAVFAALASFLTLPVRAPFYALCIAVLMALPALLF
jgi:hypothetical protein